MSIVVTGATGKLGRLVVEALLARVAPTEVIATARQPQRAEALARRGVRVRRADFAEPESLAAAFEGAAQVLVVSPNAVGDEAVRLHRAAIAAVVASGARRVVYTSHMGASADSRFAPMVTHAAAEEALRASGVAFTALRNGFYADSAAEMLRRALETGELALPADGPVAWTTHADLAQAAARALVDGALDGVTPPLTADAAVDFARIAEIASERVGRRIRRVVVSDEAFCVGMAARGVPEARVAIAMGMFLASRRGEFAGVDPTLGRLLGRAPTTIDEALAATVAPPHSLRG